MNLKKLNPFRVGAAPRPWRPRLRYRIREKCHRICVKYRWPISRGRYEREMALLKAVAFRSVEDEKKALRDIVQRLTWFECYPGHGEQRLTVSLRVTDDLILTTRSPYYRQRIVHEIADYLTRDIDHHLMHADLNYCKLPKDTTK